MNINHITISGNITREIEIRKTPKGMTVCNLTLANNAKRTANGQLVEKTTFVDVTLWGVTAETVHKFLKKGDPLIVEGRLSMDQWADKDTGAARSRLKIDSNVAHFLPARKSEESNEMPAKKAEPRNLGIPSNREPQPDHSEIDTGEGDDIPF